jgi:hypothetical protein
MTWREVALLIAVCLVIGLGTNAAVRAFDLSRDQRGWLNAAVSAVVVLGFLVWWRR